jgi:putative ABC transport system substrate-binding protein
MTHSGHKPGSKSRSAAVSHSIKVCYPFLKAREAQAVERRSFITLFGGAAVAWPLAAQSQQPDRVRRIGVLMGNAEGDDEGESGIAAFRDELRKAGWTEGSNVDVKTRWAAMNVESMRRLAKELVGLQPDLVLTSSTPAAGAMLQQTRTIPVVFVLVADPVGSGYVASLPRPGGNVTGFTPITGSLGGKWVQLLKEIAPSIARVSLLFNPPTATFIESYLPPFRSAAASLGMEAIVAPVQDMPEVELVVAAQAREPNSGLVVIPDSFTVGHRAEITALSSRYRVPAIYWSRSFAQVGGLISYGPYIVDEYRRAASYADRILKGAKPSELPVQAPTRFQLVVNLKSASALDLKIPESLRATVDEVIE